MAVATKTKPKEVVTKAHEPQTKLLIPKNGDIGPKNRTAATSFRLCDLSELTNGFPRSLKASELHL